MHLECQTGRPLSPLASIVVERQSHTTIPLAHVNGMVVDFNHGATTLP